MKKFIIGSVFVLFLTGCGGATLSQQVAQAEAAFTSSVSIINDARRPCILKSEDDPACLIKANTYNEIAPIVHGADEALDKAKNFADSQQKDQAETWMQVFNKYIENLNTYLQPVKDALGL